DRGGMFAHAPCWRASSLIQSASYPRSASNIVCGSNAAEEYRTQPIVVCLTRREGEMNWQAVGVHDRVNLARIMPEKGSSSRCMLVGAAIIRAAFPLTARFI